MHGDDEVAETLEDSGVSQAISILHELGRVVLVEVGVENVGTITNATAQPRIVEDVDHSPRMGAVPERIHRGPTALTVIWTCAAPVARAAPVGKLSTSFHGFVSNVGLARVVRIRWTDSIYATCRDNTTGMSTSGRARLWFEAQPCGRM